MMEGASQRLGQDRTKKNPFDFVLWKFKKRRALLGIPLGRRRRLAYRMLGDEPRKHLGKTIDIHKLSQDLIFPHHENEIARSSRELASRS